MLKQIALCRNLHQHVATPNLHLRQLNPEVFLAKGAKPVLECMQDTLPCRPASGSHALFSVSSFGFGGSNAFAIVRAIPLGFNSVRQEKAEPLTLRKVPFFASAELLQHTIWVHFASPLCQQIGEVVHRISLEARQNWGGTMRYIFWERGAVQKGYICIYIYPGYTSLGYHYFIIFHRLIMMPFSLH